jgi:hypothetical protein
MLSALPLLESAEYYSKVDVLIARRGEDAAIKRDNRTRQRKDDGRETEEWD